MPKPPRATPAAQDLWATLRAATPARVGIRSICGALPTATLLELQLGQAQARDAVHAAVEFDALLAEIQSKGLPALKVSSAAQDRPNYIRHPSLGRRLAVDSRRQLERHRAMTPWDLTFVVADGLSGAAVADHGLATLFACLVRLRGWRMSPIVLAQQARVALGDEIAAALNSRMCVVLIGERPGLSVSNSLGAYITWAPHVGHQDAERNCVSNIHARGLSSDQAAHSICWILEQARQRECTGTALKNEAGEGPAALPPG